MTDFVQQFRFYCRNPRCRMRLKQPVENPWEAFCTSGCHASFYRRRCVVCEGEMVRKTEHQRVCGKRRCRNALKASDGLGRYQGTRCGVSPHKNPVKMGTKTSPQKRPTPLFANAPLNILGGGSWRWPNTPRLDAKTLDNICHREIAAAPEIPKITAISSKLIPELPENTETSDFIGTIIISSRTTNMSSVALST
jgi:hypothetical protein